jgi:hypothetical protein
MRLGQKWPLCMKKVKSQARFHFFHFTLRLYGQDLIRLPHISGYSQPLMQDRFRFRP